jgi:hypothetical protein
MTTELYPVASIWVDREKRQRRELTEIPELLDSMNRVGQLNAVIIERSGELRAGERRWTAAQLGNWEMIEVKFIDDLAESELQEIELEENIRRVGLPWADECLAIQTYHNLLLEQDPNWSITQTGERLSMSRTQVGQKLMVARELGAGNKRIIEAPKLSVAVGVAHRVNQRAQDSATAAALALASPGTPAPVKKPVPLMNEDFRAWSLDYAGPKFNMIHCDFPYGINADKHDQGQAALHGGYADSAEIYFELLDTLSVAMESVIDESAHLIFWFSMDYYKDTLERLTEMGWRVNRFPLIWHKSDNTGVLPDPKRGPRRGYETAFMASRGDRLLTAKGAVNNVCPWPGRDKSIHMSEKPVGMLKHFMGMVVDEFSRVLDPTCGSGNSIKAAEQLKAAHALGLEINTEFYNNAVKAYHAEEDE